MPVYVCVHVCRCIRACEYVHVPNDVISIRKFIHNRIFITSHGSMLNLDV